MTCKRWSSGLEILSESLESVLVPWRWLRMCVCVREGVYVTVSLSQHLTGRQHSFSALFVLLLWKCPNEICSTVRVHVPLRRLHVDEILCSDKCIPWARLCINEGNQTAKNNLLVCLLGQTFNYQPLKFSAWGTSSRRRAAVKTGTYSKSTPEDEFSVSPVALIHGLNTTAHHSPMGSDLQALASRGKCPHREALKTLFPGSQFLPVFPRWSVFSQLQLLTWAWTSPLEGKKCLQALNWATTWINWILWSWVKLELFRTVNGEFIAAGTAGFCWHPSLLISPSARKAPSLLLLLLLNHTWVPQGLLEHLRLWLSFNSILQLTLREFLLVFSLYGSIIIPNVVVITYYWGIFLQVPFKIQHWLT